VGSSYIGSSFPFVQAFSSVPRPVRDECYTSVCTSVYIQACTSVYMRIHACTSVYKCVQAYTSLCKRVPACKSVYNSSVYFNTSVRVYNVYACTSKRVQALVFTRVYKCVYTCFASVYNSSAYIQACTTVYKAEACIKVCYILVIYKRVD
jgi:hypothetical protein